MGRNNVGTWLRGHRMVSVVLLTVLGMLGGMVATAAPASAAIYTLSASTATPKPRVGDALTISVQTNVSQPAINVLYNNLALPVVSRSATSITVQVDPLPLDTEVTLVVEALNDGDGYATGSLKVTKTKITPQVVASDGSTFGGRATWPKPFVLWVAPTPTTSPMKATGLLSITVDGVASTWPVVNGLVEVPTTGLSVGTHSLNVLSYSGDAAYSGAGPKTFDGWVLNRAQTKTTLQMSASTTVGGKPFSAVVKVEGVDAPHPDISPVAITAVRTGTPSTPEVVWSGNATSSGVTVNLTEVIRSRTGNWTFAAIASEHGNYAASEARQTVDIAPPAGTSTSLSLGQGPAVIGGDKLPAAAAVVVNDERPADGRVQFFVDNQLVDTVQVSGGKATTLLPVNALGDHGVRAGYLSDTQLSSTSTDLTYKVVKAGSRITSPPILGKQPVDEPVTVTVAALKTSIRPTGTIRLLGGTGEIAAQQLHDADGVASATFDLSSLPLGEHDLSFVYDGTSEIATSEVPWHIELVAARQPVTTTVELHGDTIVDADDGPRLDVTMRVADGSDPVGAVELWVDGIRRESLPAARSLSFTDLPTGEAKTYQVAVRSSGDSTTQRPTEENLSYTVAKAETETVITPPVGPVSSDDTISVKVTATASSAPILENVKVHALGSSVVLDEVSLVDGVGGYRPAGLTPGFHSLVFEYPGDGKTEASSDTVIIKVVDPTDTTLTIDRASVIVGSDRTATATATVTDRAGKPVAGDVAFTVGDGEQKIKTLDSNGVATLTLPADKVGSLPVVARFVGNETQGSSRQAKSYDVVKAPTSVSIVVPPNATAADTVTVTVAASGTSLKPTGLLRVTGRGTPKAVTLDDLGVGRMSLAGWAAGSYDLVFEYRGDENMEVSSKSATVTVTRTATSMTLTPTESQATVGGSDLVTLRATVQDAAGNPVDGVVDVKVGDGSPEAVDLTEGVAELTLPVAAVGTYDVVADFPGDDFHTGASATATYRVLKAETEIEVDVPVEATTADVATVTVRSTNSAVVPDGPVHVTGAGYDDDITLTDGVGEIGLDRLTPGTHTLTFAYQGDGKTKASSLPVTITMAGGLEETETVLSFSRPGPVVGTERFTATATVTVGGEPIGSGEVGFFLDGEQLPSSEVPGSGKVEIELPLDKAGEHELTARFTGTASLAESFDTKTYEVVPAPTEMTLEMPDLPTTSDEVTITLSTAASGSSVVPSGQMVVFGGDFSKTFDLVDGKTALPLSLFEPGEHSLMFSYDGDGRAGAASRFRTITVASSGGERATTTSLTVDGDTAVVGGTPLTATVVVTGARAPEGTVSLTIDGAEVDSWEASDAAVEVALPVDVVKDERVVRAHFRPADPTRQEASVSTARSYSVVKADTEATTTAVQDDSVGGAATIGFKVEATQSSVIPAGNVTVTVVGRGRSHTVPLDAHGEGEVLVNDLPVGRYDVVVSYEGDIRTNASVGRTELMILELGAPATQTLLELDGTDPVVGSESFGFTATVEADGEVVTTGDLAIFVDGELFTSLLVDGPVSHALPVDGIGNHDVTAKYTGGFTHKPSEAIASYNVVRASSTISLDVPAGASAASTARVTVDANGSSQVPTGRVRVTGDGFTKLVRLEEATGQADLPLAGLSAGSHSLELDYEGDVFVERSLTTATVDLTRVPTHVGLDLDAGDPQVLGRDPYSVQVAVTADDESAVNGNVTLSVDGTELDTVPVDGGPVTMELPLDTVGVRDVAVVYAGNDALAPSTETTTYTVVRAPSTMTMDVPAGATQADEATITVRAPGSTAVPSGTVRVTGTDVDTELRLKAGVASYPLEELAPGLHQLTLAYAGDDRVAGVSEAVPLDVAVDPREATTTALAVSSTTYVGDVNPAVATATVLDSDGEPVSGSVTLTGAGEPTAVTLVDGVAEWTLPNDAAGRYPLTARFAGDATLTPSRGTADYHVLRAPTELSVEVDEYVYPSDVVRLSVIAQDSSAKPTGDVRVTVAGTERVIELTDGAGELPLAGLDPGAYDLSFEYLGDDSTAPTSAKAYFEVAEPGSLTHTSVELDRTSTVVGGAAVKATAHVVVDDGTVPDGTAELWVDSRRIRSAQVVGDSVAFDLPTDVVKADREVWVRFVPSDAARHPSLSQRVTYSVAKADTHLSVDVPVEPTPVGAVAVAVAATSSSVVPTGRVHVTGSGVDRWVVLDGATGAGELALAGLEPGTYELAFTYEGDDKTNASATTSVTVQVMKPATHTVLELSGGVASGGGGSEQRWASAVVGGSDLVTATAVVLDADDEPVTGDVAFHVPGLGEPVTKALDEHGRASWTLPAHAVNTYELTATYQGSDVLRGSQDSAEYRVTKADTEVSVVVPDPATAADSVSVTVEATNSSVVPTGDVVVSGAGEVKRVQLDKATGAGELVLAGLVPGTYELTFAYEGDENTEESSAGPVSVAVVKASSSMTLTPQESEATVGSADLVRLQATVVDAAGKPRAGDVVFSGVGEPVTVGLDAEGVAELVLPATKVGAYTVTAEFAGDSAVGSAQATAAYRVVAAESQVKVTVPAKATVADAMEVSVSAKGSTLVPAGKVHVTGSGVDEAFDLDASGQGRLQLAGLTVGTYALTIEYAGDDVVGIKGSSTTVEFEVVATATHTVLELSGGGRAVVAGADLVTATATVRDADDAAVAGQVTFAGVGEPKTVALVDGAASWTLPADKVDDYDVVATFEGDGDLATSHDTAAYTVVKADTKTSVEVPDQATTADVVAVSVQATNSSVVPTGDVIVTGSGVEKRVQLDEASGAGELPLAGFEPGTYDLTFSYEGDDNTHPAPAAPVTLVVPAGPGEPVATSMSLEVAPERVVVGDGQTPVATARVLDAEEQPVTGEVVFTVGDGQPQTVGLVDGVAELDLPAQTVGEVTVSAAFTGAGYVESEQSTTFAVAKAGTSTSVTVPGEPGGPLGTNESVTVTVEATDSSVVPTGRVHVTGGGVDQMVALDQVVDGNAVGELALAGLEPGSYELSFAYEGDGFTDESSAEPVTVIVRQSAGSGETGTSLTVTPQEPQYGGPQVSVSASVTVPEGEVAGGQVAFKVGSWFRLVPVEEGVAMLKLDADKLGPVDVTAYYLGTRTLNSSVSDPVSYAVVKAHTATTVTGPSGPVAAGDVVPVSVESTGSSVVPTGRVHVTGDGVDAWVDVAGAGDVEGAEHGRAEGSFELPDLEPGSYELSFAYEGDGFTRESSAEPVTVVVEDPSGTVASHTELTVTPAAVPVGAPKVRATAVVTAEGTTPTGLVVFRYGDWYQLVELEDDGTATLDLATDVIGTVAVKAYYLGDGFRKPSTSEFVRYDVTKVPTAIAVDGAGGELVPGSDLTVTVSAIGSAKVPSGRVTVREGATDLPALQLAGGKATLSLTGLAPGSHTLDLAYVGDAELDASSLQVTVVIKPLATTTSLAVDLPTTTANGAAVTATAQVKVARDAVPTGSLKVEVDGVVIATQPAGNAPLKVALPIDKVGAHKVLVRYAGGPTEADSVSAEGTYEVTKAPSTLSAKLKKLKGRKFRVTATVTSPMPVTGTVQVMARQGKKGKLKAVGAAVVKKVGTTVQLVITTKALAKGKRPLTIRYLGSTSVLAASKTYTVRVR